MREVTNGEISGFQHFSACFVKTVMEHLQNNSPHTNKAFLDVKFHMFGRNVEVKLSSLITKPAQRKSNMV